jgi:Cdc6-like AAA superfamily ATPase/biotin operon repressor
MKYNPFCPNTPVRPGMFVGRLSEIESLENSLLQAKNGQPNHFILIGERGIGKTSMMIYCKFLAEGELAVDGQRFNFLVLDLDLDSSSTPKGFVERIELQLRNTLGKTEKARDCLARVWDFLQRIKVMDSGIEQTQRASLSSEVFLEQFATSFSETVHRICSPQSEGDVFSARYDGILFLVDEADSVSKEFGIGSFFKQFLERLQRKECNNVLVGLAGLPELRNKLRDSHPSSLRIFSEVSLDRLSTEEINTVIDICLEEAQGKNGKKTTITDTAKSFLASFSEGFPHYLHQFGHSAFAIDSNDEIDEQDVMDGGLGNKGALELIGNRYYRDDYYNKVKEESYRQVLRIMADDLDGWVSKQKIKSKFKGREVTLNNAIKALRDRGIISNKEGAVGIYKLQNKGFALWIKLYTKDETTLIEEIRKSTRRDVETGGA